MLWIPWYIYCHLSTGSKELSTQSQIPMVPLLRNSVLVNLQWDMYVCVCSLWECRDIAAPNRSLLLALDMIISGPWARREARVVWCFPSQDWKEQEVGEESGLGVTFLKTRTKQKTVLIADIVLITQYSLQATVLKTEGKEVKWYP